MLGYSTSSYTKQTFKLLKSTVVRSDDNNVLDVIIAHMMSGDAQTNRQTDAENVKDQPAVCFMRSRLVKVIRV